MANNENLLDKGRRPNFASDDQPTRAQRQAGWVKRKARAARAAKEDAAVAESTARESDSGLPLGEQERRQRNRDALVGLTGAALTAERQRQQDETDLGLSLLVRSDPWGKAHPGLAVQQVPQLVRRATPRPVPSEPERLAAIPEPSLWTEDEEYVWWAYYREHHRDILRELCPFFAEGDQA